eukprot:TRINITY_DN3623_c3_g1_i1.p1 TRINITY_DN3623_c3_g1~~TRINITY_DN3623_c3_g1_i1.p1  ORF type:complete len:897 (+),score=119.95 TRINITY_DN3623_c3_g1_i1:94-2784(+)
MKICLKLAAALLLATTCNSVSVARDVFPLGPKRVWVEGPKVKLGSKPPKDTYGIGLAADGNRDGILYAWETIGAESNSSDGVYGQFANITGDELTPEPVFGISETGGNATVTRFPATSLVVCSWDDDGDIYFAVYSLVTFDLVQEPVVINGSNGYAYASMATVSRNKETITLLWMVQDEGRYSILVAEVVRNPTTGIFTLSDPTVLVSRFEPILATSVDAFSNNLIFAWKQDEEQLNTGVSIVHLGQNSPPYIHYTTTLFVKSSKPALVTVSNGGSVARVAIGGYLYGIHLNSEKMSQPKNPIPCPHGCYFFAMSKSLDFAPTIGTLSRTRLSFFIEATSVSYRVHPVVGELTRPPIIDIDDETKVVAWSAKSNSYVFASRVISVLGDPSRFLDIRTVSDTPNPSFSHPTSVVGNTITPVLWLSNTTVMVQVLNSTDGLKKIGKNHRLGTEHNCVKNLQISLHQNREDFIVFYDTNEGEGMGGNHAEFYNASSGLKQPYFSTAVGEEGGRHINTTFAVHATSQWYSHIVAWVTPNGNERSRVHFRQLKSTGDFCSVQSVDFSASHPCHYSPSVVVFGSADFAIVWTEGPCNPSSMSTSNTQVVFQMFTAGGYPSTSANRISKLTKRTPQVSRIKSDSFQLLSDNNIYTVGIDGSVTVEDFFGGTLTGEIMVAGNHFYSSNKYDDEEGTHLQVMNTLFSKSSELMVSTPTVVITEMGKQLSLSRISIQYWFGVWVDARTGDIVSTAFLPEVPEGSQVRLLNFKPSGSNFAPLPPTMCGAHTTDVPISEIPDLRTAIPPTEVPPIPFYTPTPPIVKISGTIDTPIVFPVICTLITLCLASFVAVLWYRIRVMDTLAEIRALEHEMAMDGWRSEDYEELAEIEDESLGTTLQSQRKVAM